MKLTNRLHTATRWPANPHYRKILAWVTADYVGAIYSIYAIAGTPQEYYEVTQALDPLFAAARRQIVAARN